MEIRDALQEDAHAICSVLRRSIAELCAADHHEDPAILGLWLANKTPDIVASWIGNPNNVTLVAVEAGTILAVGLVTLAGEIHLNYVAPGARFHGISRSVMAALEARAFANGATRCTLLSTETAHRFYLTGGYVDTGSPVGKFGTDASYPMAKELPVRPLQT